MPVVQESKPTFDVAVLLSSLHALKKGNFSVRLPLEWTGVAGKVALDAEHTFSRAPEPTVDRIEELAARILKGDILLPKFQREFVWERSLYSTRFFGSVPSLTSMIRYRPSSVTPAPKPQSGLSFRS